MIAIPNPQTLLQHPFPTYGHAAYSVIQSGGLVLLPTANLWQVVTRLGQPVALDRLLHLCPPTPLARPELLFDRPATIRKWCPALHPSLETLLHHHQRPLSVRVPAGPAVPKDLTDERGEVAVRIACDSACYRLCEDMEQPLVACLAMGSNSSELPTSFGRINSDVLRGVNHIERRRFKDHLGDCPAVTIRLNQQLELEFLSP